MLWPGGCWIASQNKASQRKWGAAARGEDTLVNFINSTQPGIVTPTAWISLA